MSFPFHFHDIFLSSFPKVDLENLVKTKVDLENDSEMVAFRVNRHGIILID